MSKGMNAMALAMGSAIVGGAFAARFVLHVILYSQLWEPPGVLNPTNIEPFNRTLVCGVLF